MNHLTDQELIEYGYGEGDRAAIEKHFETCADCEKSYSALQLDLAEMKFVEPPTRDASYGDRVWESLEGWLPAYPARKRTWLSGGLWRNLSFVAACAGLLACAFLGGRMWERFQTKIAAGNHPAPAQPNARTPQRVVVVVLSDHLDRSERLLVELKHADADSTEMVSPLRDEAQRLLAANRICRKNLKQDDDPALATALDHLDRLLAQMANQPGGLNSATISRLQDQMNKDGLLFEVRVLRSRIPPHAQGAGANRAGANGSGEGFYED
ncbi:MAG: hypothetical protein WBQ94_04130 [Terracidiphilus sp.]